MGISDFLNNFLYEDRYICSFCRNVIEERTDYDEVICGNLGICLECLGALPWVSTGIKFFSRFDNETEIFAPLFYRDRVQKMIRDFKFNGMREYASVLAYIIHYRLDEPHIDIPNRFDMILPVPLSEKRMRERGYNQSALVAEKLAKMWGIEYCGDAIVRTRNTKKQSLAESPDARFENVHNAFRANPEKVRGKRVIVFDDIYTYGFTMNECTSAVKAAGASKTAGAAAALAVNGKQMLI